jgi:hypothetical protein
MGIRRYRRAIQSGFEQTERRAQMSSSSEHSKGMASRVMSTSPRGSLPSFASQRVPFFAYVNVKLPFLPRGPYFSSFNFRKDLVKRTPAHTVMNDNDSECATTEMELDVFGDSAISRMSSKVQRVGTIISELRPASRSSDFSDEMYGDHD